MVTISNSARDRLQYILEKENKKTAYVRVGVESGGCSVFSYKLGFEDLKHKDDELIEDNGIKLLVNKKRMVKVLKAEWLQQ